MQAGVLGRVVTLVVASLGGFALRRRDGRFQPVAESSERDVLSAPHPEW